MLVEAELVENQFIQYYIIQSAQKMPERLIILNTSRYIKK